MHNSSSPPLCLSVPIHPCLHRERRPHSTGPLRRLLIARRRCGSRSARRRLAPLARRASNRSALLLIHLGGSSRVTTMKALRNQPKTAHLRPDPILQSCKRLVSRAILQTPEVDGLQLRWRRALDKVHLVGKLGNVTLVTHSHSRDHKYRKNPKRSCMSSLGMWAPEHLVRSTKRAILLLGGWLLSSRSRWRVRRKASRSRLCEK